MNNTIYIANDHAGFELKKIIIEYLSEYNIEDLGCYNNSPNDYPDYADKMADFIQCNYNATGILICGTGIGMSIAANRYSHLRAALCHNLASAEFARKHNNANILVLGARICEEQLNLKIIDKFLTTEFSNDIKYNRRIAKLSKRK